jgi:hypothetical protein
MNREQDLMQRLAVSQKIMQKHGEMSRNTIREINNGITVDEYQPVNAKYNLPEEFMPEQKQITNNFEIVVLDYVPNGPAMSCLQAKILDDEPLMIINCDQIVMDFDWKIFNYFIKTKKPEAILGVFHNTSPKNSYVKLNEKGEVVLVKEKAVISNMATTGLHFWTRGGLFLNSVKQMIAVYTESPIGYTLDVGPIDNKTILIEVNDGWSLGLYPWGTMTNDKYVELITKRWCEIVK